MSQSGMSVNNTPVSRSGDDVNSFNWHDQIQVPRVHLRVPQASDHEDNTKTEEKAYECLKCQMQFPSASACIQHERSACNQPASHLMAGFGNLGIVPPDVAYTLGLPVTSSSLDPPMAHASHMGPNSVLAPTNSSMGNGISTEPTPKKKHKKKKKHKDGHPPPHINFTEEGRSYSAGVVVNQGSGEQGMLKYKCKICPQEYFTRSDVMLHARSHKEGKPHKCNTCGKGFATTSYLQQHIRIHSNEKPYPCAYCEKGFKQLSHLQQHTRIHTGDRPYKCNYPDCDKSFTQLANLQQHWRRHNKDKPYKCRDCYRAYDDLDKLQSHIHSHANTRREKRFSCGVCGKTYAQELYLMKHMAKHPQLSGIAPIPINNQPKVNNVGTECTTCKKKHKHKHKHTSSSASSSSSLSSLPTQILPNSLPTMVTANFNTRPSLDSLPPVSLPNTTSSNSLPQQKDLRSVSTPPQNNINQSPQFSQALVNSTNSSIAASPTMVPRGPLLAGHPAAMFSSPPQPQRFDMAAVSTSGSLYSAVSMSMAGGPSRHLHGVNPFVP